MSDPKTPRKYAHNRREYAPKKAPLVSELTDRPTPSQFRCSHGMRLSLPCDMCEAKPAQVSEPKTPEEVLRELWWLRPHEEKITLIHERDEQIRQQERARVGNPNPFGPQTWAEVPVFINEAVREGAEHMQARVAELERSLKAANVLREVATGQLADMKREVERLGNLYRLEKHTKETPLRSVIAEEMEHTPASQKPITERDERMWDHGYARAIEQMREAIDKHTYTEGYGMPDVCDVYDLKKELGIGPVTKARVNESGHPGDAQPGGEERWQVSEPKTPKAVADDFWDTFNEHDCGLAKAYIDETLRRRDEQIRQQERARVREVLASDRWKYKDWPATPTSIAEALGIALDDRE